MQLPRHDPTWAWAEYGCEQHWLPQSRRAASLSGAPTSPPQDLQARLRDAQAGLGLSLTEKRPPRSPSLDEARPHAFRRPTFC